MHRMKFINRLIIYVEFTFSCYILAGQAYRRTHDNFKQLNKMDTTTFSRSKDQSQNDAKYSGS